MHFYWNKNSDQLGWTEVQAEVLLVTNDQKAQVGDDSSVSPKKTLRRRSSCPLSCLLLQLLKRLKLWLGICMLIKIHELALRGR